MKEDIRWKQRFDNLNKSYMLLRNSLEIKQPDVTQRAGIIQFFEITFELAWKTLKDYLEENGFNEINSPRDVIKTAFQSNIIHNGHAWLKALKDRNLSTHTYQEEVARKIENDIRTDYFPLIVELIHKLEKEY